MFSVLYIKVKQIYRFLLASIAAFVGFAVGLGFGMNFGGNYPVPFEFARLPGYEGTGTFGSLSGGMLAGIGFVLLGSLLRGHGRIGRMLIIGLGLAATELLFFHFFAPTNINDIGTIPVLVMLFSILMAPAAAMLTDEWFRTPPDRPLLSRPALLELITVIIPFLGICYFISKMD